ncbi:MAG: Arginine--tRNA ligase [Mycoplasmataceae bacterium]|nr:MAG: Arginine--tRNA ligase [Mycoplasmataceae bacterium]
MNTDDKNFTLEDIINEWKKISSSYGITWKDSFIKWDTPEEINADFAITLALPISHILKKKPYEIALKIKNDFPNYSNFEISISEQGYLNCNFKSEFFKKYLNDIASGSFLFFEKKNKLINIEFVSVNPTGYLHLGHLRNAIIGDTISNIYQFIGYKVIREYYINDRGNQIKDLLNSVLFYYFDNKKINFNIKEDDLKYKGVSTKDAALYFSKNEIFSLKDIEERKDFILNKIIGFFIDKIKSDLILCGVKFDNWFSEKKMYENKEILEKLLKDFELKNLTYKKDNALFLKTESAGDDKDRVIIKENGDYTYFLSDIIYHIDKLNRSDFLINIWGSDHHGYIGRLLGSLDLLGYNSKEKISIILIQMVSLLTEDGNKKFSKRLGTSIDVDETLKIIEKDQLRFCLLEKETNHSLVINSEILNDHKENSRLYYVQYAHARCNQILLKWESMKQKDDNLLINDFIILNELKEREILNNLIRFSQVVINSAEEKKPFLIIQYLQSLSKDFQSYYQSYAILQNNNYELSKQRVILVKAVKMTLSKGLELCGISAPDFMEKQ